jgi:nucleotide-binding universal stress UspA family protein
MRTIVVGLDHSEQATRALQWALEEAELTDARLIAGRAWTMPLVPVGVGVAGAVPEPLSYREDHRAIAEEAADQAMLAAGLAGQAVDVRTAEGSPADVLAETALAEEADLLVVGTRGHGGLASLVLGSVSSHLVRHAPCPVVVVPCRDDGGRRG